MTHDTHDTRRSLFTRLVALMLACTFVLQSAARAGEGCLARVFSGTCCCAAAPTDAAPTTAHSCCAPAEERTTPPSDSDAPAVLELDVCGCALASPPSAPLALKHSEAELERSLTQIAATAGLLCVTSGAWSAMLGVEQHAPERPPDKNGPHLGSLSHTRLAQRGVSGWLAELCTLLR